MISEATIVPSKSIMTPSFKKMLKSLPPQAQDVAADKYKRWISNPQSLNFEPKFNNVYVVEVLHRIHAIALLEKDNVVKWIWIGKYDAYEGQLRALRNAFGKH